MRKLSLVSILILIFFTSLIKNSTKEIEDKIFAINENLRSLKNELSDVMLEYNYLSSPERIIQYQSQYFENELIKTDITKIKILETNDTEILIKDFINKMPVNE
jgi:cell division protein FtsL